MKNKKNVTLILSILMLITISFSGCAYVGSEVNELNGSITGNFIPMKVKNSWI